MKEVYDSIGAVPRESVSFENVIKPLIDIDGEYPANEYTSLKVG